MSRSEFSNRYGMKCGNCGTVKSAAFKEEVETSTVFGSCDECEEESVLHHVVDVERVPEDDLLLINLSDQIDSAGLSQSEIMGVIKRLHEKYDD